MDYVKKDGIRYCGFCGKEQTEVEILCGQCNECDPFEDAEMLDELYGEAGYIDV